MLVIESTTRLSAPGRHELLCPQSTISRGDSLISTYMKDGGVAEVWE